MSKAQKKRIIPRSMIYGSLLWVLSLQYYTVQIVVAAHYNGVYSWLTNTISDLGNTVCGSYGGRSVCSPLYTTMNVSFLVMGITMIAGCILIGRSYSRNSLAVVGFAAMGLSGIGTILVGMFPENTTAILHILGAGLAFIFGNAALFCFGASLSLPPLFRRYTMVSGAIALIALVLFVTGNYIGIGIGGIERIVAYPQSIWLIVFGMYSLRKALVIQDNTKHH